MCSFGVILAGTRYESRIPRYVIPAKAGIQARIVWIPGSSPRMTFSGNIKEVRKHGFR